MISNIMSPECIRPWSEVLDVEGNQSVLDEGSSMAGGTLSHGDRSPMLRELARREACESLSKQAKLLKNQQTEEGGSRTHPSLKWTWRDKLKNSLKRKVIGMQRWLRCRGSGGLYSVPNADPAIDMEIAKQMGVFGNIGQKAKDEAYQFVRKHRMAKEAEDRRRAEEAEKMQSEIDRYLDGT